MKTINLGDLKAAIQLAEGQGATDTTPIRIYGSHTLNTPCYDTAVADVAANEADYIGGFFWNGEPTGNVFYLKMWAS